MAVSKDVLDELMKSYKDLTTLQVPMVSIKQRSKALIERAMQLN
ncbi:hypothetical protein MASR2M78_00030 [Treponema sp.]